MTTSGLMEPFSVHVDMARGVMGDPDAHNIRHASDLRGYYVDGDALDRLAADRGDPIHYETFAKVVPEAPGHLLFCITRLYPGLVGQECFMTKGHYHTQAGTGEVYLCLAGTGYMMMKTSDGQCRCEPMREGGVVYAPPHWAHRSINTGDEPLILFCVWPADAGHNYGDIAKEGFPKRVFRRGEGIVIE